MIEIKVVAELLHHFQDQVRFCVAIAINDHCCSKGMKVKDSITDSNQPKNDRLLEKSLAMSVITVFTDILF